MSHASRLIAALRESPDCHVLELAELGQTRIRGLRELEEPPWQWADGE
ncbi:MAG: hypothetical protein R3E95_00560 [Thiolinea sp.]